MCLWLSPHNTEVALPILQWEEMRLRRVSNQLKATLGPGVTRTSLPTQSLEALCATYLPYNEQIVKVQTQNR